MFKKLFNDLPYLPHFTVPDLRFHRIFYFYFINFNFSVTVCVKVALYFRACVLLLSRICLLSFKNFLIERSLISLGMEFQILAAEYLIDCYVLLVCNTELLNLRMQWFKFADCARIWPKRNKYQKF